MISESVETILARQEQNQQWASGSSQNIVDKDGFLRLLIAQMEHQDPLSPMDNSQLMSQMAQFSTLEQLQNMNANLDSSLQWDLLFNQTINNTMATSLIGREVEAAGDELLLGSDGEAAIRFELSALADQVTFEIVDSGGNVVYSDTQSAVDAGMHEWNWDGRDAAGTRLPTGTYQVRIAARDTNDQSVSVQSYRVGIVDGVAYEAGNAFLIVNGQRIGLGDVQRISMSDDSSASDSDGSSPSWPGRPTGATSRP